MVSVRAFMKASFSVMPSSRKDFCLLMRWMTVVAPLHGWSKRSEYRGIPGRGLWLSLLVLRFTDVSSNPFV
jgi:hypothetical protein